MLLLTILKGTSPYHLATPLEYIGNECYMLIEDTVYNID